MGIIFEELIRKFNEENNEEAGEHFTPRDVVELMSDITFLPVVDKITDDSYLVYDGACGTGGMLTIAEERLQQLAKENSKQISINLYGQEINPETYAITKADMLLKGEGDISDTRFVVTHRGETDFKLIPRSSDGQLLFLANKISKMKHNTELGSRIVKVHNGSSLFTGDAGQGESNLRRFIIENDWLKAIIALPENMFYNTGIATFIWVVTNRKAGHRRGKVQLIDATEMKTSLRKNLGNKNCEFTAEIRKEILDMLVAFEQSEQSKIFKNEAVIKGINSNVKMKPSGIEWLGDIPEHWVVKRCKFLYSEVDNRSQNGEETHLSMSQKYGLIPNEKLEERHI